MNIVMAIFRGFINLVLGTIKLLFDIISSVLR
jgi:hypothetical protein